jgi:Tfp pilus assembly protein FimV
LTTEHVFATLIEHLFGRQTMRRLMTMGSAAAIAAALVLSYAAPSPGAQNPRHYTVHPGDTLWAIAAKRYPGSDTRDTVVRIQQANDLGGGVLAAGQTLVLP